MTDVESIRIFTSLLPLTGALPLPSLGFLRLVNVSPCYRIILRH
jgi:hypothetical protein